MQALSVSAKIRKSVVLRKRSSVVRSAMQSANDRVCFSLQMPHPRHIRIRIPRPGQNSPCRGGKWRGPRKIREAGSFEISVSAIVSYEASHLTDLGTLLSPKISFEIDNFGELIHNSYKREFIPVNPRWHNEFVALCALYPTGGTD
jgi:hypothetical protein